MAGTTYHFGPFSIDTHSLMLFRNGERLQLPPKAADLLVLLVERQGQLVTKDELLKHVWPDTFVEEGNLSKHIFLLRKILGESPNGQPYIETVPKRGYRFLGSTETGQPSGAIITAEERTSERVVIEEIETTDPPPRLLSLRAALGFGVALVVGLLAWTAWTRTRPPAAVRSLLVLPFANLGQKAETEYFVDGLTDELIAAFAGVRGLRVVPRTTAFQLKGKSADVQAIGRQMEVEAVLDGGVQREKDRLRVRLALTRVSDGQTLWSQTYDKQVQDIFATQDEIAGSVLRALFPADQRSAENPRRSGTKSVEAQNLYHQANFIRQKIFNSSLEQALALYKAATDIDPNYAEAWAGQAYCYFEQSAQYRRYPMEVSPLALETVHRALQLNPRLSLAHTILGMLNLMYVRDWGGAKTEFDTAIAMDPNDGEAHHWMSHYWVSLGRFEEAKRESRRAFELDPLNFQIGSHQVWVELHHGNYPAAIRAAEPTLRMDPAHGPTSDFLMTAYEESGQFEAAIEIRRRMGWERPPVADLEGAFKSGGAAGYWRVRAADLEARRKFGPVGPIGIATAYAHVGDRHRALAWIEQAVEERDIKATYLKVYPAFASLRNDPRFQKVVKTAGIP